ncbi:phenylalanine--tRNA ligase subunit beta [Angustibacter speluncae]
MRVPLTWLAETVDTAGATPEEVAAALVRVGLEEEATHGGDVSGPVVVGRVLTVAKEPQKNGKTISWCTVDVGPDHAAADGGPRGIVCGAHNFGEGDLVVVSLPGAVLAGGFAIASRKTYGHVSDGMICSAAELGLGDDHGGIVVLTETGLDLDGVQPGDDAIALLGLDAATVEVNVTPDRGYCFSVRGVAREYGHSVARDATFRDPADVEVPAPTADAHPVSVRDDAPVDGRTGCARFVGRVVRGIDPAAPSAFWLQRRLQQAGMRPISLAVDVTNYVMLWVGQPLHAYDLGTLDPAGIVVRRARAGERLTTLDGVVRELDPQDLLITDGPDGGRIIGLAGVMGGAETEVGPGTTDVLVEAAWFDPVSIARTARRHRLPSEASKRFERGVDPRLQAAAAELAVRLLVEHGGGTPGPVGDLDDVPAPGAVRLPSDLPARLVGVPYAPATVVARLREIGCQVDDSSDVLDVLPPSWRPDLAVAADLVEEVARLEGYDAIPSVLPVAPAGRGLTRAQRARRAAGRTLAETGWDEVLTYPFVAASVHDDLGLDADDPRRTLVRLANPLSDEQPFLRSNLLSTLLTALRRNVSRGAADVRLFEIGMVTRPERPVREGDAPVHPVGVRPSDDELAQLRAAVPPQPVRVAGVAAGHADPAGWWGPGRPVDHGDAIAAARGVARALGVEVVVSADVHAPWHPGRCARLALVDGTLVGHAGELHPQVCERLGLPARSVAFEIDLDVLTAAAGAPVTAQPVSAFPVVKEDVALVVADDVPAADVERALREGGGDLLEDVRLFDVYTGEQVGEGRRSLAFALRMRAPDRTLTADELAAVRGAAVAPAGERHGAVLRGA